jgi:hypothetical protein
MFLSTIKVLFVADIFLTGRVSVTVPLTGIDFGL